MRVKILFLASFILTIWGNLNGQIDERQKAKNEVYSFALTFHEKKLRPYPYFMQEPQKFIPWGKSESIDTIITYDPITFEESITITDARYDSIRAITDIEDEKKYKQDYQMWKEMVEHGPKVIYVSNNIRDVDLAFYLECYGLEKEIEIKATESIKAPAIDVTQLTTPSKDFVLRNLPEKVKAFHELYNAVWILYFSDVFFNKTFDKAILYIEECHYESGNSFDSGPFALEKKNGVWQVLKRVEKVKQIQRE